ncbi:uridine kinase [Rathayibacter oskolensis]|uniref:Uridine kinase n=1 Tax=Rathayibacter oskolensis TaxID=1891671 RepID=A0A1X7NZQ1_9MICO|nr:uridine kinase [Rathayibacter oskolensis]
MVDAIVAAETGGARKMVAVDGIGASGKTTLARLLQDELGIRQPVVVVHADDFFNPVAVRRARGRYSPEGFWLDTYDLVEFERSALAPLRSGEDMFRPASFDREAGVARLARPVHAESSAVVIVEGTFLHRDELAEYWDYSIFLDVPFDVAAQRMQARAGAADALEERLLGRYFGAQRLYFEAAHPWVRASIILDNSSAGDPRVITAEESVARRDTPRA